MNSITFLAAAAIAGFASYAEAGASGTGVTTRFWDCCKPSCAWPGLSSAITSPLKTCDINDKPLSDPNAQSGCNGGSSYMCSDQTPWAIDNNLAYGYAAVNIQGQTQADWCCSCYKLSFTSGSVAGKTMIVQAVNTGGDLKENQFDLAIPAGGVGIFNGCSAEWHAPNGGWGQQYGGISAGSSCSALPSALQPGCNFRFGWMGGADNPGVQFEQVACPSELTAKSGCKRSDDSGEPGAGTSSPPPSNPPTSKTSSSSSQAAAPPSSTPASPNPSQLPICPGPPPSTTTTAAVVHPPVSTASKAISSIWEQCGGRLWTGPTQCAPGLTCQVQNPWYSQCLNP